MKIQLTFFILGITVFTLFGCANGKKLMEEAPVDFGTPYYISIAGQDTREPADYRLVLPLNSAPPTEVSLDSVFFRGRKAALSYVEEAMAYTAEFPHAVRSEDMIMSSDPVEEYGNQVPVIREKIPFDLEADELVVEFTKNEKLRYFKIGGIGEKGN